ncbi:MAG: glycosyltransferase family 4 protein [Chloroflexota bacterium]
MALLHYAAAPVTGGVEAVMAEHARLLAAAGHDVRVIAGRGDCELVPELDSRHPEVEALYHALGEGRVDIAAHDALRDQIGAALRPLLEDRDVVIAHNVLTMPFNLPLAAALAAAGKPLLAWTHDIAWVNERYREYRRARPPYDLMRTAVPGATYVVISDVRRHELREVMAVDPAVVPNGIDFDHFLGIGPDTRAVLGQAGLDAADPLVLVPLRVTRRKRLELAITAAGRLRHRHPRLMVAVSGPLGPHSEDNRQYWTELFELRARLGLDGVVRFLHELTPESGQHPVTDAMIAELYRVADVVLLPSESEGFGLPVIEAAAARVPMVCSAIDVLREVGGSGLHLFPLEGGADAVAEAVEAALAEPLAEDRRRVAGRYAWPQVVPQIEAAVESALA